MPWFYSGTTSLVYADTCGSAVEAALGSFGDDAWVLGEQGAIPTAIKCAIVAFFEYKLPRMQDRDAKGVMSRMRSQSHMLQGWRDTPAAERHVERIINKSLLTRVALMITMKLCDLSGTLILVEQFKAVRLPRGLKVVKRITGSQ